MTTRKEREKEARRTQILDAAARVFSNKSYLEATLDEVAAEAELAKGTLYLYFKNKQDLFVSLMHRGHEQILGTVRELSTQEKSLEEFIRYSIEMFLAKIYQHRYLIRLIMTAGAHLPEQDCSRIMQAWQRQKDETTEKFSRILSQFPETGHLTTEERHSAASLILGAVRLLFSESHFSEEVKIPQKEIDNYARFLTRAISVEKVI